MDSLHSNQLSLSSYSKYGNKLLKTHTGLQQILKRIELSQRKVNYQDKRQHRPPCYHPGAIIKKVPIKNSSSFLCTPRNQSSISNLNRKNTISQFKYYPDFKKIAKRSPSWTIPKSEHLAITEEKYFKICSRNPFLLSYQNPQKQINQEQSILTTTTQVIQNQSIHKQEQFSKKYAEETMYNSRYQTNIQGFQILSSIELTKSEIKHLQKQKRILHNKGNKGYVNMLTQTSRPSLIKVNKSTNDLNYLSYPERNIQNKIHNFSSYIQRRQSNPKPMPQYHNLNYDTVKPKLIRGHFNFSLFQGRKQSRSQTRSHSLLDNMCPNWNAKSPNFLKMKGRLSELFPKNNNNIKKKGDSTILRILQKASKRCHE